MNHNPAGTRAIVSQTERPIRPRLGVRFASGRHPAPNVDGILDARSDGGERRSHEGGRRPQWRPDQGRRRREGEGGLACSCHRSPPGGAFLHIFLNILNLRICGCFATSPLNKMIAAASPTPGQVRSPRGPLRATAADAQRYVALGVTRIGTSNGVALVAGARGLPCPSPSPSHYLFRTHTPNHQPHHH